MGGVTLLFLCVYLKFLKYFIISQFPVFNNYVYVYILLNLWVVRFKQYYTFIIIIVFHLLQENLLEKNFLASTIVNLKFKEGIVKTYVGLKLKSVMERIYFLELRVKTW